MKGLRSVIVHSRKKRRKIETGVVEERKDEFCSNPLQSALGLFLWLFLWSVFVVCFVAFSFFFLFW